MQEVLRKTRGFCAYIESHSHNGVMLAVMDRKLLKAKYPKSIKKDNEFLECRQVLERKARELRAAGIGGKPNRANSLRKKEENIL